MGLGFLCFPPIHLLPGEEGLTNQPRFGCAALSRGEPGLPLCVEPQ